MPYWGEQMRINVRGREVGYHRSFSQKEILLALSDLCKPRLHLSDVQKFVVARDIGEQIGFAPEDVVIKSAAYGGDGWLFVAHGKGGEVVEPDQSFRLPDGANGVLPESLFTPQGA